MKFSNVFPGYCRIREPNIEYLSYLTFKAKGSKRSINEFAKECGVSPSTISRIINKKNTTPNSDKLIKAIAENADIDSEVTLDMLLDAHGLDKFIMAYDSLVDRDHMQRNSNGLSNRLELDKNIPYSVATMRMLIMNKLYEQGNVVQEFKYNDLVYKTDELKYKADFVLVTDRLKSYGIKKWAFDVYIGNHRPIMHKMSWIFGCCYMNSLRDAGIKMSLLMTNKEEFETAKRKLSTITIHDMISIILVDEPTLNIEQEYLIPMDDGMETTMLEG